VKEKMLNEGNQIHNFISSSGSGTVINYGSGSGSDFLTSYGSGSSSTKQKDTVPTVQVPVPVPQHCRERELRKKFLSQKYLNPFRQCCGYGFIESRSRSSISIESRSGSRVLMTKVWKNTDEKNYLFLIKKMLFKGHPSFRRSLQP
jgi:hypothetical protein